MNRYGLDDACTALPHLTTPGVCNRCGSALTGRRTQWCSDACQDQFRAEHDWGCARQAALVRDRFRCVRCGGDGSDARPDRWLWMQRAQARRVLGIEISYFDAVQVRANRLPWLEVNHITPRCGGGYQWGCWNHQANLETLCHGCHVAETNRQAAERRGVVPLAPQPTLFEELAYGS